MAGIEEGAKQQKVYCISKDKRRAGVPDIHASISIVGGGLRSLYPRRNVIFFFNLELFLVYRTGGETDRFIRASFQRKSEDASDAIVEDAYLCLLPACLVTGIKSIDSMMNR